MPTPQTGNWKADSTKHLQAAHITLVLACFVCIIASTLAPTSEIDEMLQEVRSAVALDRLMTNQWLEHSVDTLSAKTSTKSDRIASMVDLLGAHVVLSLNGQPIFGLSLINDYSPGGLHRAPTDYNTQKIHFARSHFVRPRFEHEGRPRTIGELRADWDSLWGMRAYTIDSDAVYTYALITDGKAHQLGSWTIRKAETTDRVCFLTAATVFLWHEQDDERPVLSLGGWDKRDCSPPSVVNAFDKPTLLPIADKSVKWIPLTFVSDLLREINAKQVPGSFRDTFYRISEITVGLENLTLAELLTYAEHLRSDKSERVEVIGIQLPLNAVSLWGAAVVIVLQGYVLMLLAHFCLRGFHRDNHGPWIALFPKTPVQVVFQVSVAILPVVACLGLACRAWIARLGAVSITVVVVENIASVIIGMQTFVLIRSMSKQLMSDAKKPETQART